MRLRADLRVLACALMLFAGRSLRAQEPQHDVTDLAKQTQNPVSDLITLPFQFNFNGGGDLEDGTFLNVNFQPVMPFTLTEDWKVIARTIVPLNSFPGPGGTRFSGVGDIQEQLYITPSRPGAMIWGVGPVFSLPTATATPFETGSWAVGPGAVVVKNVGSIVLGGLINQYWTFADAGDDTETNLFVLQPFINFNFSRGWALAFAPLITANWDASDGNEWTVPLGLGITKTTVFNKRPMNIGVQYYYNIERPDGSAAHTLRFVLALLFPG